MSYLFIPMLLLEGACQKAELAEESGETKTATVTFATKTDSEQIEDLNIYAFNTVSGKNLGHLHVTESTSSMTLPLGKYEFFAIANAGRDLGCGLSLAQVKETRWYDLAAHMPMSGSTTANLLNDTEVEIELTRCVAKINLSISVSQDMPNMVIQSVQLRNVADTGLFFPKGIAEKYLSDRKLEYTLSSEKRNMERTYYTGENCRGTVASITSQREKNMDNAPKGATYLLINALCENRFCTYRVFLGENNTYDFNIRRNAVYNLNISIKGEDDVDTRMESDPIYIEDDMELTDFPGACIPGEYNLTFSPIESKDETYTAEIEVISGDPYSFMVNDQSVPMTLDLGNLSQAATHKVSYKPSFITSDNTNLEYTVTIRSGKGNVYTKHFKHMFCNRLFVITSYPEKGYPIGGDVKPTSDIYGKIATDKYTAVLVFVGGSKETLQTACDDGFALAGWYHGLEGKIITQNEEYTHPLAAANDTLAMKFKRDKYYIYTDLENVQVLCLKMEPVVKEEKSAYAVEPGYNCTIEGKDKSRYIAGWYDDPVLRTSDHLVSASPSFDFLPETNMKLYPEFK